jgi:hypothetical protein
VHVVERIHISSLQAKLQAVNSNFIYKFVALDTINKAPADALLSTNQHPKSKRNVYKLVWEALKHNRNASVNLKDQVFIMNNLIKDLFDEELIVDGEEFTDRHRRKQYDGIKLTEAGHKYIEKVADNKKAKN